MPEKKGSGIFFLKDDRKKGQPISGAYRKKLGPYSLHDSRIAILRSPKAGGELERKKKRIAYSLLPGYEEEGGTSFTWPQGGGGGGLLHLPGEDLQSRQGPESPFPAPSEEKRGSSIYRGRDRSLSNVCKVGSETQQSPSRKSRKKKGTLSP